MSERPCEVSDCPAFAEPRKALCGVHRHALTAKALHIAKDVEGRGGKRCVSCGRTFADADWCERQTVAKKRTSRPGDPCGYRHVACEPPTARLSRRAIRESEKPLLFDAET